MDVDYPIFTQGPSYKFHNTRQIRQQIGRRRVLNVNRKVNKLVWEVAFFKTASNNMSHPKFIEYVEVLCRLKIPNKKSVRDGIVAHLSSGCNCK
mmetsp:Transcript_9066/g.13729  ORF Transcript_9066/g.13729 Transcript_9066/m.13729 type:complete len:94 (-) Transcript_9066:115-396(-)